MRLDAFINNKQPVLLKNRDIQLNSYSNTIITDITDVSDATTGKVEPTVYHAKICGIKELATYKLCIICDGKVLPSPNNLMIGCCQKCKVTQKTTQRKESLMAKATVRGYVDEQSAKTTFTTLVGLRDILQIITNSEDITDHTLLDVEPFNFGYNVYSVITSVSRARH